MKKWRNKILSAVLVLSLLLTSSSFALAVGDGSTESTGEKYTLINDQLTVTGVSSYDNEGPASNAVDKTNGSPNTGTFWHTFWDTKHPHDGFTTAQNNHNGYIIVDLKSARYFSQLGFLPRQNGAPNNYQNGRIMKYEVYVSSTYTDVSNKEQLDGTWTMASKGNWDWTGVGSGDTVYKYATLETPVYARYVKLQARKTYDGHVCASNINFFEDITGVRNNIPTITTQPQSNTYLNKNEIAPLNVTVTEDDVTYQWYKTEDGTLDSGVEIQTANSSTYKPTDFGNYFVKVTSADDGSYVFSNIAEIKAYEAKIGDNKYETFADAMQNVQVNGTIEILTDITISSTVNVNKSVTIKSAENDDGSVYTMNRDDALKGDMFKTSGNGNTLTLENIIVDGGAEWTGETDSALGRGTTNSGVTGVSGTIISVTSGCTFNFEDGAVLQNGAITSNGGAIYNASGTINLNGGKIKNNAAGRSGGAIYSETENGVININENVIIEGNSAGENGAVLFNNRGEVNIDGSIISMNKATNGGAVYVNNGTLNLGEANNDYALTISGNTATNGDSIYYGGTGTININAKLKLDGEIYLHTNGMKINQKCDLSGSAPITLVGNRSIEGFITVSNDSYKSSALNVFRVKDGSPAILKPTVISGSDLNVVRNSSMSISNDLGDNLTYYRGIENNLYKVTGSDSITYTWYEKVADSNDFTEVGKNLDLLSDGTHTVYCVASDGTNYMVSDVAEITVKDFYPCSKAIEKFKSI